MKDLARAARNVRRARRELRSIKQCPATLTVHHEHPYVVRCDLLSGHDRAHRHRPLGQLDSITWH